MGCCILIRQAISRKTKFSALRKVKFAVGQVKLRLRRSEVCPADKLWLLFLMAIHLCCA